MICLILGLGSLWRFLLVFWSSERSRRTAQLIAHGTLVAMAQQLHLTSKAYELLRRGIAPWEKAQQKATQLLGSGGVALIHRIDEAIDAERAC